MSDMIEEIVEVMAAYDGEDSAENFDLYEPYAKAALTALMHPSASMIEAGEKVHAEINRDNEDTGEIVNLSAVFSAMINHVLEEAQ